MSDPKILVRTRNFREIHRKVTARISRRAIPRIKMIALHNSFTSKLFELKIVFLWVALIFSQETSRASNEIGKKLWVVEIDKRLITRYTKSDDEWIVYDALADLGDRGVVDAVITWVSEDQIYIESPIENLDFDFSNPPESFLGLPVLRLSPTPAAPTNEKRLQDLHSLIADPKYITKNKSRIFDKR